MDLFTLLFCKKKGGGGSTYTLAADQQNKQITLTSSKGDVQHVTVPYATDASTINGSAVPELQNGKIPSSYLPSYVDDVEEYASLTQFPVTGETGKIYIDLSTNRAYRWSGSEYFEISPNEDSKTAQVNSTDNGDYRVLLSSTANDTAVTDGVKKSGKFTLNPSNGAGTIGSRVPNALQGGNSFSVGEGNTASGQDSFVQGAGNTVSGALASALGTGNTVSGNLSNVMGASNTVSGDQSHAEGEANTASGRTSHAEGASTTASGSYSHSEGVATIANHKSQHVFGEYNIEDSSNAAATNRGDYVEIIGNGTATNARSNARTLDWSGNEELSGNLNLKGSSSDINLTGSGNTWDGTNTSLKAAVAAAAAGGSDVNVTQTATSTNADYEILFSGTADDTTRTEGAGKSSYFKFNPSKKAFTFGDRLSGSTVGEYSVAMGHTATASEIYSYAEGYYTSASGLASHAEGSGTSAIGESSHAEGSASSTAGRYAHAEGLFTRASHQSQHVFGEYNIADPSTAANTARGNYIEIVGNGTSTTARSNARTLDWSGNEWLANSLKAGESVLLGNKYTTGGSLDKVGLFIDDYYDENLDITFSTEVTPQEIYLTSQPAGSVSQTAIIASDQTQYQTSLLSGTEVINTVNAIGMEVNVKENGSTTHGIKIVSGDIRLLGSDTWDGTNISLKNALATIQNNLYIANYNKTASLSSGSNTIALDMTGYTYNGSDIVNVYVDGLYKVNNTDYTITVNDSTGVASINYTAAAAGTIAIQVIKPKIGFTALTDNNGDNVTDSNGNSIDI